MGTVRNTWETIESLMFSAWGPLPPAHSFPDPLTVMENASKSIVKQSKTAKYRVKILRVPPGAETCFSRVLGFGVLFQIPEYRESIIKSPNFRTVSLLAGNKISQYMKHSIKFLFINMIHFSHFMCEVTYALFFGLKF